MSELEGQQRGLWESHVSFVRAPEREREKGEREREREGGSVVQGKEKPE